LEAEGEAEWEGGGCVEGVGVAWVVEVQVEEWEKGLIGFEVLSFSSVFFCLLATLGIFFLLFVVLCVAIQRSHLSALGVLGFRCAKDTYVYGPEKRLCFLGSRHYLRHGAVVFRSLTSILF
jgi:hypothetical protein